MNKENKDIVLYSTRGEARYVSRKVGNNFVQDGEEIIIDGTENITYVPLCGKCYLEKVNKIDLESIKNNLTGEEK